MNTPNEPVYTAAELEIKNSLRITSSLYEKRYNSVQDALQARNASLNTLQVIDEFEGSDDPMFMAQLNEVRHTTLRWLEDTEAILERDNINERKAA